MTIEERAATLAADLGADEAIIHDDLEDLVEYSVPLEEAERSLRRKYGDREESDGHAQRKAIADIDVTDDRVTLVVTVLSAGRRPIQYEGEERIIIEGDVADSTGRIGYTAWDDVDLEPGETVELSGVGVREWDGGPELNIGARTTVTPSEADVGVEIDPPDVRSIESLQPGDRDVSVEASVIELEERVIDGRDGPTRIWSGVLGEQTGRLPFTDWVARGEFEEGIAVNISNAYVREFRGVPTLNLSRFSTVTVLDDRIETSEPTPASTIRSAVVKGGAFDTIITGTMVDLREGSGLIERCPECRRVTRQRHCRTHGDVNGEPDLRIKGVLDDGTATATVILDQTLTESVYGGSVADAVSAAKEAMDQSVVMATIRDRVLGRRWITRGRLSVDDFGATLDATSFEPECSEAASSAASLLEETEGIR